MTPQVVIVGRPNVGKSSLFNWLAEKRIAIEDPTAGVTRDRLVQRVELDGRVVDLVDTGNTLKANRLLAVEEIMPISSRLVVNQAALKLKREALQPVIEAIAAAVGKRG